MAFESALYRLKIARGFLEESHQDVQIERWRSAVDNAQLAVENSAKAVLSLAAPVGKSQSWTWADLNALPAHMLADGPAQVGRTGAGGGVRGALRMGGFMADEIRWSEYEKLNDDSCIAIVEGLQGVVIAGKATGHRRDILTPSFQGSCSYSPEIGEPLGFCLYSYRSERCDEILPSS